MAEKYPTFDHDVQGHADPEVEPGRVFFDPDMGRVVCSEHGDTCATDGSLLRKATVAKQVGIDETGVVIFDHANAKPVGDARLYRCTVCGQGTWTERA